MFHAVSDLVKHMEQLACSVCGRKLAIKSLLCWLRHLHAISARRLFNLRTHLRNTCVGFLRKKCRGQHRHIHQPDSVVCCTDSVVCCTDSAEINCQCSHASQLGAVWEKEFCRKELSSVDVVWCRSQRRERGGVSRCLRPTRTEPQGPETARAPHSLLCTRWKHCEQHCTLCTIWNFAITQHYVWLLSVSYYCTHCTNIHSKWMHRKVQTMQ